MIRVLIVEDDPMVAQFNSKYLEQVGGFKLSALARSVDDALKVLEKQEVDLILLDIFMPGLNGLDLLERIRNMGKSVDVIVVSAACDKQSINKALQYGAVDYLIKPFEFERFNAALSAYRERVSFMQDQDIISQADLDKCILNREQISMVGLPKGLDKNTLLKVWDNILQIKDQEFSTEELAQLVGISRVSVRKYLEFLTQKQLLKLEISYGSVGRPVYKYRCIDPQNTFIERFQ